jgi:hypothetical protein
MIEKLKKQLQETHEDLEQSKQELWSKEEQVQAVKQEVRIGALFFASIVVHHSKKYVNHWAMFNQAWHKTSI